MCEAMPHFLRFGSIFGGREGGKTNGSELAGGICRRFDGAHEKFKHKSEHL